MSPSNGRRAPSGRRELSCLLVLAALAGDPRGAQAALSAQPVVLAAPTAPAGEVQLHPEVAFGGGRYLVVWQAGVGARADIRAARLDSSGKPLDSAGLDLATAAGGQHHPSVAYSGSVFLVVWADLGNGKDYDIYGTRVDAAGKQLDNPPVLIAGGAGNQARPHVTATPSGFFVAWEHFVGLGYAPRGARVGTDGTVIDAKPIVIFDPGPPTGATKLDSHNLAICQHPRAAVVGGKQIQVVWTGADKRIMHGRFHVMGARVDLNGAPLGSAELFKPQSRVFDAALAAGGGQALVSWTDLRARGELGGDGNAQRVDAAGAATGGLVTLGGTKGRVVITPALAHSGKSFVIAFVDRETDRLGKRVINRLQARTITASGVSAGSDVLLSERAQQPAIVGDGSGRSLVVYTRLPAKQGERPRVATRLLIDK